MNKYFGTDGIRDAITGPLLSPEFLTKLGWAFGAWLNNQNEAHPIKKRIAIGRDTRESAKAILESLSQGLSAWNISILDAGILPTPGLQLICKDQKTEAGIMITASHNPASDNGIKVFNREGLKLSITEEIMIEALIDSAPEVIKNLSLKVENLSGENFYRSKLQNHFKNLDLTGMRIAVDCANGATTNTTPALLKTLGATIFGMGIYPNGQNINANCGSENPAALQSIIKEHHCDIGIAHDGDGDRLLICDSNGKIIPGDVLLAIFALAIIPVEGSFVTTIQTNNGVDQALKTRGIKTLRVAVGDRNVFETLNETKSLFGGEPSGHYIFREHGWVGDGFFAALKLLEILKKNDRSLTELAAQIPLFHQKRLNLRVKEKKPFGTMPPFDNAIEKVHTELSISEGRALVRYSGTEPKLRLLVEGPCEKTLEKHLAHLVEKAKEHLDIEEHS
jgi:phosphoglucosamine mutase